MIMVRRRRRRRRLSDPCKRIRKKWAKPVDNVHLQRCISIVGKCGHVDHKYLNELSPLRQQQSDAGADERPECCNAESRCEDEKVVIRECVLPVVYVRFMLQEEDGNESVVEVNAIAVIVANKVIKERQLAG
jgi:hypothetical protein